MTDDDSTPNENRVPLKKFSIILGIWFLMIGISTAFFLRKENFEYFAVLVGLYFMFDAFKERLKTRFGQKNIKIMGYIFGGILLIIITFNFYQSVIK